MNQKELTQHLKQVKILCARPKGVGDGKQVNIPAPPETAWK